MNEDFERRRRIRNYTIAALLAAFVLLFYLVSVAKLSGISA
ncbi:MAG: hypothetical protein Tsb008_09460 [Rhodothalassiaceae bacterium]